MVASVGEAAATNGYTYDNRDIAERFAARAPIFRVLAEWSDQPG